VLDLVPIQKGVGFSVAAEKMVVDAQAIVEDVKQKLMKTNTKYKEATERHHRVKVFKEEDKVIVFICKEDKVIVFICKERFLMGSRSKLQHEKYGSYIILKKISDDVYIINYLIV
jgi:6-phosphogluconolactonase (cycloisomerase 2 family)